MKKATNSLKKLVFLSKIIGLVIFAALDLKAAGNSSGGGGDDYTADFLKTLETEVHPWLFQNGHNLPPSVTSKLFKQHLSEISDRVESDDVVYESCDRSKTGRKVVICYNYKTDTYIISRSLYPKDRKNLISKRLLLAHELFRRMKDATGKYVEGDNYEVTRQISMALTNPEKMSGCIVNLYQNAKLNSQKQRSLIVQSCERTAGDIGTQKCLMNLVNKFGFTSDEERELSLQACELTLGEEKFVSYIERIFESGFLKESTDKNNIVDLYLRGLNQ